MDKSSNPRFAKAETRAEAASRFHGVVAYTVVAVTLLSTMTAMAQSESTPTTPPRGAASQISSGTGRVIEEVVVTANRRTQNVQDIVGGIRVFDGAALEKAGAAGFEDYVFRIPGADFVDDGAAKKISLRGVSNMAAPVGGAGGTASPIGIYLGDTPIQGNGLLPDLALYDLQRIEVLKGPQGTLYGEGAQGGAVKMLLNPADPGAYSAKGEVGFGRTENGSGWNQFQHFAVNAPVYGSWAVRLVGSRRIDQGYVDFSNRGTRGEDDAENLMGRIHVDGAFWEGFSLSAVLFHQQQRLDQYATAQLAEGDLTNRNFEPEFDETDFSLAGLTLDYELPFATLTSSTSAFVNDRERLNRFPFVGAIAALLFSTDVSQPPNALEQEWIEAENHQFAIAQELRLVSPGGSWLDWVAGFFYRHRDNDFDYFATNSAGDVPPPVGPGIFRFFGTESFEQYALFGEITLHLPWALELGAGLRGFREEVSLDGTAFAGGPLYALALAGGNPDGSFDTKGFSTTTTAVTPKLSLTWRADDERMIYAQVANGVRSGGTNTNALTSTVTPLFEPDSLWAYEVGAKTQWLDGRLTANLSLFHNDWKDLQVGTGEDAEIGPLPTSLSAILNVARAFSRGAELELLAIPREWVTLGFNLFVGTGEIIEGDPAGNIADHTRIPQLADLSYSAFAELAPEAWRLFDFSPSFQFETAFTGARTAFPALAGLDPSLEGFQLYNALAALTSDHFEVSIAVSNLTDTRPQLGSNFYENSTLTIGRPRTWTARVAFQF